MVSPGFQGLVWVDPCYEIHSKVKFAMVSTQSPNAENLKGFHQELFELGPFYDKNCKKIRNRGGFGGGDI